MTSVSNTLFSAADIAYAYPRKPLFEGVDVLLKPGDSLQVLGNNGVGKSTLLRIFSGLLKPLHGCCYFRGEPIALNRREYHADLFYLSHQLGIKKQLTVLENIHFSFRKQHLKLTDILPVLADFDLTDKLHTLCTQLSRGQLQRVALSRLCLSRASIWLLDEPFSALDQQGVPVLCQKLDAHLARGGCIVFTAHREIYALQHVPQRLAL